MARTLAVASALAILFAAPLPEATAQTVTTVVVMVGRNLPMGRVAESNKGGSAGTVIAEFGRRDSRVALRLEAVRSTLIERRDALQNGGEFFTRRIDMLGGRIGATVADKGFPRNSPMIHAAIGLDRVEKSGFRSCPPQSACTQDAQEIGVDVALDGGVSYRHSLGPIQLRMGASGWAHLGTFGPEGSGRMGINLVAGVGSWFPR